MAEVEELARRHTEATTAVRARILAYLAATWDGLGSYRETDIERLIAAVVPVVLGGQRQIAALTDAYLAGVLTQVLGHPVAPRGVDPEQVSTAAVRGADPAVVYARPIRTVWSRLAEGVPFTVAAAAGATRLADIASSDLQLAKTHTARRILSATDGIVGYRRTLRGTACGLCVVASTQRYHRSDLMPIHPGCSCGVLPLRGAYDPGQVIDEQRLAAAHSAIQQRFGLSDAAARDPDYRKILLVREHGELGPVLTVASHRFTGPDDIPTTA